MALTTHTVTLETEFPGGAPLDGTWTLTVVADPPLLLDTEGHVVFAGKAVRETTAGVLVLELPETGQTDLDPPEALWSLAFLSKDKSAKLGPFVFDLAEDKTLDDIAEATGIPITPSLLSQTIDARDAAIAAQGAAEAAAESFEGIGDATTTVKGRVELATEAEAATGTDTVRAVTPAGVAAALTGKADALASASSVASGRTLALTDAGDVLETTSASGLTLTVPTNAAVAFPVGTLIEVYQSGAGQVTIAGSGGVTLRSRGGALKTAGQYATIGLRKRGTDEWVVAGDAAV